MSTLYELTEEYQYLYDLLSSGEIDEQTFNDSLEGMFFDEALEIKAESCAKIITMLVGYSKIAQSEAERLTEKSKALSENAKRLQKNLYEAMKRTNKKKFKTALFSFWIQKNSPSVFIAENAEIPSKFIIEQPPKIGRRGLLEALKNGAEIDGVSIVQDDSLRIK